MPSRPKRRAQRSGIPDPVAEDGGTANPALRTLAERLPLLKRPGYLVRRLHQVHSALFLEECAGFGITPVQYGLLTVLSTAPDSDQITLAGSLGIDRTNVSDVLARLQQRGLVSRVRSRVDRRMVLARLTPEGERLVERIASSHGAGTGAAAGDARRARAGAVHRAAWAARRREQSDRPPASRRLQMAMHDVSPIAPPFGRRRSALASWGEARRAGRTLHRGMPAIPCILYTTSRAGITSLKV